LYQISKDYLKYANKREDSKMLQGPVAVSGICRLNKIDFGFLLV
jgi:hypothetical protein